MIFNGDLSHYHPADAIMFLSQLNLNGVFSIAKKQQMIALNFRNGFVTDAHSKRSDIKILQALIYQHRISTDQVRHIRRIQSETGMPIRSILAQLDFFPLSSVTDILLIGMKEALLEMFLLDSGSFHFTDTLVDTDDAETRLDARALSIGIAAQSDEFRDFEKSIVTFDRELTLSAETPTGQFSAETQVVVQLASNCKTVGQLLEKAPFDSHSVMEIVKEQLETGTMVLLPPPTEVQPTASDKCADSLFGSFRQALKKLILTKDPLKQLEALVTYCRGFYDGMLIITSKKGQLVHYKQMVRRKGHNFVQKSEKGQFGRLDQDSILLAVNRSGVGFFGKHFPSKLLDSMSGASACGECALIPIATPGAVSLFLYVFSEKTFTGLSPQHYLELLSWTASPRKNGGSELEADTAARQTTQSGAAPSQSGLLDAASLVSKIDDLPPLSMLVNRALELLSDPSADIEEVEAVIGKDQSLVSKLIRVSNSALYGGLNRVESLKQALTRLGAKTTKSLIVAASMQTYFLKANRGLQARGQLLWHHAAECGIAARRIANTVGYDDPEKAFVGGVVHDIGKLAILMAGDDAFRQIQNVMRREALPEFEAERRVIGTDHVAIGVKLMEKWKMPESARLCVQCHHSIDIAGEKKQLAAIAAYANHLSHLYGAQPQQVAPEAQAAIDDVIHYLGLSEAENNALVESAATDFQDTGLL